jgi:hypothetical protein
MFSGLSPALPAFAFYLDSHATRHLYTEQTPIRLPASAIFSEYSFY